MGYLEKRKKQKRENVIFFIVLFVLIISSAASFVPFEKYPYFLLAEYRFQYFFVAGIIFILSIFKSRFKSGFIAFLLCIVNLAVISSHVELFRNSVDNNNIASFFDLMVHRTTIENQNSDLVIRNLEKNNPDIAVLIEMSDDLNNNISKLSNLYPFFSQGKCHSQRTCGILSKFAPEAEGKIDFSENETGVWQTFSNKENKFTIVAVDEGRFLERNSKESYDLFISRIADFIKSRDEPVILVGGFSSVPWSESKKRLEIEAGLMPRGGLVTTWPAKLPFVSRMQLDYIYMHSGIEVKSSKILDAAGSDYRPIMTRIIFVK